jgi:hypothetical protein
MAVAAAAAGAFLTFKQSHGPSQPAGGKTPPVVVAFDTKRYGLIDGTILPNPSPPERPKPPPIN